jgi:MYXO-CTERM domain-containing protein
MRSLRLVPLLLLGAGCLGAPTFVSGCGGHATDGEAVATSEQRLSTGIVVSALYGAGGNSGATWKADYVELFNAGSAPVSLAGMSLQYASSAGSSWSTNKYALTTTMSLQPGQYYLVQLASGTNGAALPVAADETSTINMSATDGKVALVANNTALTCTTACASVSSVVEFVGFGAANDYDGTAAAPAMSTTKGDVRGGGGCTQTHNNATDFASVTASTVSLHNSLSPLAPCAALDAGADASDAADASDSAPDVADAEDALDAADSTLDSADADDAADALDSTASDSLDDAADAADVADSADAADAADDSGAAVDANDAASADADATVDSSTASDTGSTVDSGADSGSTADSAAPDATSDAGPGTGRVVISGFFGAGGNSGAIFTSDYVELFNRGPGSASLGALSVQYASSTGTSWTAAPLSNVTLVQGQYYLVELAGGTSGAALPAPDTTGTANMAASNGKIALVNGTAKLTCGSACASDPSVLDFVGYGTANDYESAAAPAASANTAGVRAGGGCIDTNDNSADFSAVATPVVHNTASPLNDCSTVDAGTDSTTFDAADASDSGSVVDSSAGDSATPPGDSSVADSAVAPDTAVAPDSATVRDTGVKSDAGKATPPVDEASPACSCATPGGSSSAPTALVLAPLGLALVLARRRSR